MKTIILVLCTLACALAFTGPEPPLWPETFSQDFVLTDKRMRLYETGKLWFDDKNSRIRFDFSGSSFQELCFAMSQDRNASCSLINVKGALYVNLPQKSKCCTCCTQADNCALIRRDWLKDFKYVGEASLSGQTFYKWTYNYTPTLS